MKFWLCASFLALAVTVTAVPQKSKNGKSANELYLAGFRPGRDTIAAAKEKFGKTIPSTEAASDREVEWRDTCGGQLLKMEADKTGIIEIMDLRASTPMHRCSPEELEASKQAAVWKTGRGLRLGDNLERVIEVYGKPNSKSPSEEENQKLELLFYMFDWAGSDVPQVMEISCDQAAGRVVGIMLAFPSL